MSFYLGTGGSGKIMHITKGSYSDTAMQGSILPDTVFHSDLPYITFTEYSCTVGGPYFRSTTLDEGTCRSSITIDSSVANDISVNKKYYFFIINGTTFYSTFRYISKWTWLAGYYGQGVWCSAADVTIPYHDPSSSANIFNTYDTITSARFFVVNIVDGQLVPPTFTSSDILVRGGNINIKGINLLNFKFLSKEVVNSIDPTYYFYGSDYQLINLVPKGATLDIKANSSLTEIKAGGHVVFSTNYPSYMLYAGETYTIDIPPYNTWSINQSFSQAISNYSGKVALVTFSTTTLIGGQGESSFRLVPLDGLVEQKLYKYQEVIAEQYGGNYYYSGVWSEFFVSASAGTITFRLLNQPIPSSYRNYTIITQTIKCRIYILQ